MMDFVLYWGCRDKPGHFLTFPNGATVRGFEADRMMVPSDHQLDGTFLFLPRPEKVGDGALTYLPATDRTILAWWGSPFDKRGAINSAIIVSGNATANECWQRFALAFPTLEPKLAKPIVTPACAIAPATVVVELNR